MLERPANFAICLMSLGLPGCLSNHCEVYPEHCVEDGMSEGSSGTGTETTDDTGTDTTDDTDGGEPGLCGDGLVEGDEECDDGNEFSNDSCTSFCTAAVCGDGIVQSDVEECDAGQANGPGNACTSECVANVCGDGLPGPGEGCDDGNDVNGDQCTNACALATCGDGLLANGETCDDGNAVNSDACLNTCVLPSCGDGFVFDGEEECDNAQLNSDSNMCTSSCVAAVCGDGLVWLGGEDCDDGNMVDFDPCSNECLDPSPELQLTFSQIKQFEFGWAPVFGAEYYQLLESKDNGEDFVQVGGDIVGESLVLTMPLHLRLNASYKLLACNGEGCSESAIVDVVGSLADAVGYFKASNTGVSDVFGFDVALSADGNTLAVGACGESSSATGVGNNQVGSQASNSASYSGAVYVFVRSGVVWSQQAYVKASNTGWGDAFGFSVDLSADGNTLAVGALSESSSATGIDGDQANNSASYSGAVYVFVRSGVVWSQQAYVKASNTDSGDHFGADVALSGDGNTLAVGANQEESSTMGINGDQADDTMESAGAVYVFVRSGVVWSQQAYVKASNPGWRDYFGGYVALSGDGNTLAVGAHDERSNATGINGDQYNDLAAYSGAAYVFVRSGVVWSQQAYVKASNTAYGDSFGAGVALSGDGNTLAVGARGEDSSATGIGGNEADNSTSAAGAVYVFARNGVVWSQQAYVKASNPGEDDYFGYNVALSGNGNILAIGAYYESSNATGIGGNQADNSYSKAGAVYVFARDGMVWSQQAYVKASNSGEDDYFGYNVTLSGDGNTLAVGASHEDSSGTGISGNQASNFTSDAGAVYLY